MAVCTCLCVCICVCACMCMHMCVHACVCMHVSVCLCVHAYVYMPVCACLWRIEVNVWCLPQPLSTLFSETRSLSPWTWSLLIPPHWLAQESQGSTCPTCSEPCLAFYVEFCDSKSVPALAWQVLYSPIAAILLFAFFFFYICFLFLLCASEGSF